jgi:hypothetical protein
LHNDPTGHCPECVLAGLIFVALVLSDYSDNGKVDTLSPDALIISYSVNDSTRMTTYADDKDSPVITGVDAVFTTDQAKDFYTNTHRANIVECPPKTPCVNKSLPNPHVESPSIGGQGSVGLIWSQSLKKDIDNYKGRAYNVSVSVGPISLTGFSSVNKKTNKLDYDVVGLTVGFGYSPAGASVGAYYTNSKIKSNLSQGECYTGRGGVKSSGC